LEKKAFKRFSIFHIQLQKLFWRTFIMDKQSERSEILHKIYLSRYLSNGISENYFESGDVKKPQCSSINGIKKITMCLKKFKLLDFFYTLNRHLRLRNSDKIFSHICFIPLKKLKPWHLKQTNK
jgi:hypothetical protein